MAINYRTAFMNTKARKMVFGEEVMDVVKVKMFDNLAFNWISNV